MTPSNLRQRFCFVQCPAHLIAAHIFKVGDGIRYPSGEAMRRLGRMTLNYDSMTTAIRAVFWARR